MARKLHLATGGEKYPRKEGQAAIDTNVVATGETRVPASTGRKKRGFRAKRVRVVDHTDEQEEAAAVQGMTRAQLDDYYREKFRHDVFGGNPAAHMCVGFLQAAVTLVLFMGLFSLMFSSPVAFAVASTLSMAGMGSLGWVNDWLDRYLARRMSGGEERFGRPHQAIEWILFGYGAGISLVGAMLAVWFQAG